MEKSNDVELKVGDFIRIGISGHIREVLACREYNSRYDNEDGAKVYHICYPDAGIVQTKLYHQLGDGDIFSRVQLGLAGFCFTDSTSVTTTKYGDAYEVAECLLDDVRGHGFESDVWNFMGDRVIGSTGYRVARSAAVTHSPEKDGAMISLYLTAKDRKRSRRTTMKAGRAFKHMLNNFDNQEIASLTEAWIEVSTPRNFTLKVGGERSSFRRAYCGVRAAYRNPTTTQYRKSLATSCMHAVKVDVDSCESISPAEVFATGDFKIAWLETEAGHIAGRVVFSTTKGNATYAPIYGACEQSLDMLEAYMKEVVADQGEDWAGLNLINIDTPYGKVGPYLDCGLRGVDNGKYITLSNSGDIAFETTNGYTEDGISCEICGDATAEHDVCYTDDGCLCEYCFNEHYVHLDCGETCPIDEAVEVNTRNTWSGRISTIWVYMDDAAWCDPICEYWHVDDVEMSECGECIPTHRIGDFPELFPTDETEEVKQEAA